MTYKLFDDTIEDKGDAQEWFIKQKDTASFTGRVKRLKYLHRLNPDGKTLMGNVETVNAYREMQWCYIEGFYLSVIVLSQSLIEKILQDRLSQTTGVNKKDLRSLSSMLRFIKSKNLIHDFLIERIDQIRKNRNPITHLRYVGDQDCIDIRSYHSGNTLEDQLERDAKRALEVAIHFALCKLNTLF